MWDRGQYGVCARGGSRPFADRVARLRAARRRGRLAALPGRRQGALDPRDCLDRLAGHGCTVDAWETTYLHVLDGADPVLDWVRGTALRPVLAALSDDPAGTEDFLAEY